MKVYINKIKAFFLVFVIFFKRKFSTLGLQQRSHNGKPFLRINLEVDFCFIFYPEKFL